MIDDQLSFPDHIATTAQFCRFALYNIRKIRPFLSEQIAQLLVQALVLSRLDYCNALLVGLSTYTIKPLQLLQKAAVRVVFNEPKKAHVTLLFISLHWLPITCLRDNHWHCTNIPKLTSSDLCALQKLAFCTWMTPCGAIPKKHKSLLRTCSCWWNDLNPSSSVFSHFQKTSEDTSFHHHLTN